jgi:uracil-DNA glycosylase family 4
MEATGPAAFSPVTAPATGFTGPCTGSDSPTSRIPPTRLIGCYITAAIHCAPPDNKPLPVEFLNCRPYLLDELRRLKNLRVVVPLGLIAFKTYFAARRELGKPNPRPLPRFGHGLSADLPDGVTVISSYHPSQQNTLTGKLTETMLDDIFRKARALIDGHPARIGG